MTLWPCALSQVAHIVVYLSHRTDGHSIGRFLALACVPLRLWPVSCGRCPIADRPMAYRRMAYVVWRVPYGVWRMAYLCVQGQWNRSRHTVACGTPHRFRVQVRPSVRLSTRPNMQATPLLHVAFVRVHMQHAHVLAHSHAALHAHQCSKIARRRLSVRVHFCSCVRLCPCLCWSMSGSLYLLVCVCLSVVVTAVAGRSGGQMGVGWQGLSARACSCACE